MPLFLTQGLQGCPLQRAGSSSGIAAQQLAQVLPGMAGLCGRDIFRRALRHHITATVAAFRTHVDQPIGRLDDVQVVFDDEDGVAAVDQLVQHLQQ
ncbi:hypothetical protein G6F35_018255 [Rhizopus arrhizus]|nr:hypothetical protein G6F35_018255 [Rhizopus arrhizus]